VNYASVIGFYVPPAEYPANSRSLSFVYPGAPDWHCGVFIQGNGYFFSVAVKIEFCAEKYLKYTAYARPEIDAATAEKGRFRMKTVY